jgi:adenylyltransferase/sulfurtransferase
MAECFQDTRYNRQMMVPLFGEKGQASLSSSSIVIVGAGGVKSSLLYSLVAAGVGRIRIIDFDKVELSNLNRQILYQESDIGEYKSVAAARRLSALNSEIEIEAVVDQVSSLNFDELLDGFDLIFEGGDSGEARKEFNINCVKRNWSYIHASAQFNYSYIISVIPKVTGCFDCVFRDLPVGHKGPVPVIGTATLMAGSLAASEAISYLVNGSFPSVGKILMHDGWVNRTVVLEGSRNNDCVVCG